MSNVLVIAVGKHKDNTLSFENMMVSRLKEAGVNGVSAHAKLPDETKVTRDIAASLTTEHNSDMVIVTRLITAKLNRKKVENRTELVVDRPVINTFTDIFSLEISEQDALLQKELSTTVIVSTEVFSATDGSKLAVFETEVAGVQDPSTKMHSSIEHVIKKLKAEGFIK